MVDNITKSLNGDFLTNYYYRMDNCNYSSVVDFTLIFHCFHNYTKLISWQIHFPLIHSHNPLWINFRHSSMAAEWSRRSINDADGIISPTKIGIYNICHFIALTLHSLNKFKTSILKVFNDHCYFFIFCSNSFSLCRFIKSRNLDVENQCLLKYLWGSFKSVELISC